MLGRVPAPCGAPRGQTDAQNSPPCRGPRHTAARAPGVGIAQEQLDKIFTAFYTTKAQGLRMGLAISRTIVEQHGVPGATVQFILRTAPEAGAGWSQKPSSSWTPEQGERR
jgi:hypothetical protein